jgi:ribosome-associated protein
VDSGRNFGHTRISPPASGGYPARCLEERTTLKGKNKSTQAREERKRAERIIEAARSVKAEEILLYDMDNRSSITDYVLICSGRSQAHVRGIAEKIETAMREGGFRCSSLEGQQEGSWVLMDFDIVLVHVFHPETRAYYDLESLLSGFACERVESESADRADASRSAV